ncbi:hypothetical protein F6455_01300 [Proteobacteria bacterium 005FR1]|nr:hypothetical protein [Proteobacteria bacterium 005FR1]
MPSKSLVEPIVKAIRGKQQADFALPNDSRLTVLGKENAYRLSGCSLANLFSLDPPLRYERDASRVALAGARDLSELKWTIAFELATSGALPASCSRTDVFRLRRWPNFTRIPHRKSFFRIAALVLSRPTSVDMIHRILKIPQQEALQFYAAAHEAGYTEVINRKAEVVELKPHRHRELISSLLSRLGVVANGA